jgi:hypothetical protein
VPPVGGLCLAADFDQMWSNNVSLIGGLWLATDFDQMWFDNVPLVRGLCLAVDFDQKWSNNVPLVGGRCLAVDFDQMWSKHVPLNRGLHFAVEFDQIWIKQHTHCQKVSKKQNVWHDILKETRQDGPFDLLKPGFNLSSCKMDSSVVYGYLKTLVIRLASDTVHEQLFSVVVPRYSMESQTVLDHIWQSYINKNGGTIHLSAQVYYTTFLNLI